MEIMWEEVEEAWKPRKARKRSLRFHEKGGVEGNETVVEKNEVEVGEESDRSDYFDQDEDFISSDQTVATNFEIVDQLVAEMAYVCSETKRETRTQKTEIVEDKGVKVEHKSKLQVTEFDVERVLQEQETHDLFCPNCNSCITKRVILRKRKRTGQGFKYDSKHKKVHETRNDPDISAALIELADEDRDREPVFGCLSLFSFFIPREGGFNLFQIFGKREEDKFLTDPQEIPAPNRSLSSIFETMTRKQRENRAGQGLSEQKEHSKECRSDAPLICIPGFEVHGERIIIGEKVDVPNYNKNSGKTFSEGPEANSDKSKSDTHLIYRPVYEVHSGQIIHGENVNDPIGDKASALGGEGKDRLEMEWNFQEATIEEEVDDVEFEMRAVKRLQSVHELKTGGIHPARMPLKNVLVGNDSKMEQLKAWVFADDVGVIGIVGPGGIGKTSLLRQIQIELPMEGFKSVIYVNIKKNSAMLEQVQKEIIRKLDFPWLDDTSLRTRAVFNALNRNKFALLLDNVSGMLDLRSIGVPIGPESTSQNKVIVATESTVICHQMGAERLLVMEGLTEVQAWHLFQQNAWKGIDSTDLDPDFVQVGRLLVEKCGGVPLSLIIVARAVTALTSVEDWRKATNALSEMQSHYAGTEREPYFPLEFCLNNLQDSMLRSIMLYCSLFPENASINMETLIDYCIADGLLGEYDHIDEARAKGHDVIDRLVSACLLEKGIDKEKTLRIHHEMIRDMALCLASSHCYGDHGKSNILVDLNSGPQEWSVASIICLVDSDNQLNELPEEPICLNLLTLLLQNNTISRVPCGFFREMPNLRILDLSRTRISVIPSEVGMLGNLRFLSLAYTELTSLPSELGQLEKLAHLDLTCTFSLSVIPHQALSMLSRLQVLYMFGCVYGDWIDKDSEDDNVEVGSWKLVGHVGGQPGDDEKKISYGGDDERGMGNWKLTTNWKSISYGGDDERGMGDWKLINYGGDDEREMGNWKLTSHGGGDDERGMGNWKLTSHGGGDDERGMGNWKLTSHGGGDDERGMGNWKLENAPECEPGNWRIHGGDDERGVGNWRIEASSSKDDIRQVSFDDLDCLGQLSDLRLTLCTASCLARFFKSPVLPKRTQLLHLHYCSGLISIHTSAFRCMKRLRELHIQECGDAKELIIGDDRIAKDMIPLSIEFLFLSHLPRVKIILNGTPPCKVFQNLRYLSISECHELKDATWVLKLPCLEDLILCGCNEMEHMISSDGEEAVDEVALLPRLKRLALIKLPKLKLICKQILVFPALEFLGVTDCAELTKLPLGEESAINLKEIRGDRKWWNSLQWEDNNTKYAFAHVFKEGNWLD